ncbi:MULTISPECIES: Cof-type HAD-IIB family hydrolase [Carnobacterium]|nr:MULTISPECIES: Cof-type HAD-IIB family hydrolase [Carnobacterium]AOA00767.1 HAD family hydrolase [Carnobacterium divergens]MCO6016854.1 Cof-type HAD-IIB family hydrolase [Carnobacterium divergens]MDO0874615.1 Cof-type HAD-IIB family hydrolase [Carnobacterium divergens]MDT1940575.1 Cof-type HAD-IIB family hydrolase [Carnobacterium divergens]MDT1943013.1 Cof-type HAD-IIB family hydrolase [Carnobacterium divergens]
MIELIASDMDGTLLNEKMVISKTNAEAIAEAERRGIRFMVSTGRGYTEAHPLLAEVGISCPMITLNGAQVYDEFGQIIDNIGIDKATVHAILKTLKEHNIYAEMVTSKGIYSESKVKRIESVASLLVNLNPDTTYKMGVVLAAARLELMNINYVDDYQELVNDESIEVLKLIAFSDDGQRTLQPIKEQLESLGTLAITSSFINNIEINHKNAQKGIALKRTAKKLGIPLENVMAIGDNFNDVSMLDVAGVSFAMENAEEDVKKHAKHLTSNNNENGVAEAIMRSINENL